MKNEVLLAYEELIEARRDEAVAKFLFFFRWLIYLSDENATSKERKELIEDAVANCLKALTRLQKESRFETALADQATARQIVKPAYLLFPNGMILPANFMANISREMVA